MQIMTVEELKREAAALDPEKQGELVAFLIALRHLRDPGYQAIVEARTQDKNPAHWLTAEQFETRLGV